MCSIRVISIFRTSGIDHMMQLNLRGDDVGVSSFTLMLLKLLMLLLVILLSLLLTLLSLLPVGEEKVLCKIQIQEL